MANESGEERIACEGVELSAAEHLRVKDLENEKRK
jgi:hypothetical protein